MDMGLILTLFVFIVTLGLVIVRPKGIHEAAFALAGALLLLAAGLIGIGEIEYIWGLVWNATLSLIAIMMFTAVLDENGFFRWAALHIVRRFGTNWILMFAGLTLLGSLITIFFNNDGTVLILTPIVLEITALLGLSRKGKIAFLLGVGFIADTASAPLMMSNLTNILTADFFRMSFQQYAERMLLPGIVAIIGSVGVLLLMFGKTIYREQQGRIQGIAMPAPNSVIRNRVLFYVSWAVMGIMIAGYLFGESLELPVAFVALTGAVLVWVLSVLLKVEKVSTTLKKTPWLVVVFALSMYLVVYAVHANEGTLWLADTVHTIASTNSLIGIFGSGLLFSALAALINNLPAVLVSSLAIDQVYSSGLHETAAYLPFSSLIGTSVGAKLTPIGSLATLLWMQIIRREGVRLSWGEYMKYGLLLTMPVLLISLLSLWLAAL